MCLFLEISWVKKCNVGKGKYFPITVNIFPMPKIWNFFFWGGGGEITSLSGFSGKNNQRKYMIYFINLWLIWGNIYRKREKSAKIPSAVRHSFLSRTFPVFGKYFPMLTAS